MKHLDLRICSRANDFVGVTQCFNNLGHLTLHFRVIGLEMNETFIRQPNSPAQDVLNQQH